MEPGGAVPSVRHSFAALLVAVLLAGAADAQPSFLPLGRLEAPWGGSSRATGVSDDGSVVIGVGSRVGSGDEGFVWDVENGMRGLGGMPAGGGFHPFQYASLANAVSADGRFVVGSRHLGNHWYAAFRWESSTGVVLLGHLPGGFSYGAASALSADGSVIGGACSDGETILACVWGEDGAARALEAPEQQGDRLSSGVGWVSPDGSVLQGGATHQFIEPGMIFSRFTSTALEWNGEELTEFDLGTQVSGFLRSDDGSTRIASRPAEETGLESEGIVWRAGEEPAVIPSLPGRPDMYVQDLSADGRVLVGTAFSSPSFDKPRWWGNGRAFVWTEETGTLSLESVLIRQGVDLKGWTLLSAEGITPDGRTVVGSALNPDLYGEAFVATLPEPAPDLGGLLAVAGVALARRSCARRRPRCRQVVPS